MKILVIQPNWNAYSEVWLIRMMDYLENNIVAIATFAPPVSNWRTIPIVDLYGSKGGLANKVLRMFSRKTPEDKVAAKLEKLIRSKKVDRILIHFIGPALYLHKLLAKVDVPVFIHVHGIDIFWHAKRFKNPNLNFHPANYTSDVKKLSERVTFIVNSEFSKKQLTAIGVPNQKILIKYFGVPQTSVVPRDNNQVVKILYLGRFVDFKAPDIVIKAFELACNNGMTAELVMAGDGPLYPFCEMLRRQSPYQNRIKLIGSVSYEQAVTLFCNADIYTMHNCKGVLTETYEAFGVSIIEAMSFGLPVVTGNCGGPIEIIDNGIDGILVTPGSIEEHANAFLLLSDYHKRQLIGNAARQKVETRFSVAQEQEMMFSILNKGSMF